MFSADRCPLHSGPVGGIVSRLCPSYQPVAQLSRVGPLVDGALAAYAKCCMRNDPTGPLERMRRMSDANGTAFAFNENNRLGTSEVRWSDIVMNNAGTDPDPLVSDFEWGIIGGDGDFKCATGWLG